MNRLILGVCAMLVLVAQPAQARRHKTSRVGEGGAFAYYLLSLSWSPEYCADHGAARQDTQCAAPRSYGFVVHGLWPQYERGFPESCPNAATLEEHTINDMLDVMPSPDLVRHEWQKHGTCSGMRPAQYFALVRQVFNEIHIPPLYVKLQAPKEVTVADLKRHFLAANPDVDLKSIAVLCKGKYLQEVRICLDRSLEPRACGADVRDRCNDTAILRPMR